MRLFSERAKSEASPIALAVTALCLAPTVALAQTADGGDDQQPGAAQRAAPADLLEELVVTSSRIVQNGFSAPTPTTVLGAEDLLRTEPAHLADAVNALPQLFASQVPATGGMASGANNGANLLNLRGLGVNRTLVMLDSRRVVPNTTTSAADINLFPSPLVSRVDVVTGGASAAWGSDAVSGVVNFILDTDFTGLKGSVEGGQTTYGDGENAKATLTFGTDFAGGRGHVVLSGMAATLKEIRFVGTRDWYDSTRLVQNPAWVAGGTQPFWITRSHVGLRNYTLGGLITGVAGGAPASLVGTNFLTADGARSTFTFGTPSGAFHQIGGTFEDPAARNIIQPSDRQYLGFLHAKYDLTENLTAFFEATHAESKTEYHAIAPNRATGLPAAASALTIRADNAFLPSAIRSQMPVGSSFLLGRADNEEDLILRPVNERITDRFVAGLNADLGGGWTTSGYLQYGRAETTAKIFNSVIDPRLTLAADAVVVTAANVGASGLPIGSTVCRSRLTTPANGCVPFNPFGFGAPSAAAMDWVNETAQLELTMEQTVAAVQLNGEPFSTWAGPVALALGAEWRKEELEGVADPLSIANSFRIGNFKPIAGDVDVTEGFVEADVPLLQEVAFADRVSLNTALRYTDYSTSGGVTTWKLGVNWAVNDDLRLRATRSRDIRAPNMQELFAAPQTGLQTVFDPVNGTSNTTSFISQGNQALDPETSDQWAAGFVYRPSWLPGFGASVDYYEVEITDAITTETPVNIVNYCFQGLSSYCPLITRNAGGTISNIFVQPVNANLETLRGLDIELSYRTSLQGVSLPGNASVRLLLANILERTIDAGGVTVDRLGLLAIPNPGPPKWRGAFSADYTWGPSTTSMQVNYMGSGKRGNNLVEGGNQSQISIDDNSVDSFTTVDLSQRVDLSGWLGRGFEIFGSVRNVFDEGPPVAVFPGQTFIAPGTNIEIYDMVGRQYRIGLRFQF